MVIMPLKSVLFLMLSLGLVGNVGILFGGNFINFALAQTTCDQTLSVTKVVAGSIDSATANNLPFTISIRSNDVPIKTTTLTQASPLSMCVNVGDRINVSEDSSTSNSQFTFGTPSLSSDCSTTVQAGVNLNCRITDTVTGTTNSAAATPQGAQSISLPGTPEATNTAAAATPQGAVSPEFATQFNPPFQTCKANVVDASGTGSGIKTAVPGLKDQNAVRQPSENSIDVQGSIPLDKVKKAMVSLNTNIFTIQMIQDLNPTDGIKTAIASPSLTGRVIVASDDGLKQKIIDFNVQNARTECKFITLAEAVAQANTKNVKPLGELRNVIPGHVNLPDTNKLLGGLGSLVQPTVPNPQNAFPQAINPPFATCQGPAITFTNGVPTVDPTKNQNTDNLALYNIKGTSSDLDQISGHSLIVEINSDTVFTDTDHAAIFNNNNPLIKVNLISDDGKSTVHKIGFTLSDLWTDCKEISANSQDKFNVLAGENGL
jgi:hypothetical protein